MGGQYLTESIIEHRQGSGVEVIRHLQPKDESCGIVPLRSKKTTCSPMGYRSSGTVRRLAMLATRSANFLAPDSVFNCRATRVRHGLGNHIDSGDKQTVPHTLKYILNIWLTMNTISRFLERSKGTRCVNDGPNAISTLDATWSCRYFE